MAEYNREKRNQLSRVIANSGTRSSQLKGFVDNRDNAFKQNSFDMICCNSIFPMIACCKVLQRSGISDATLNLYIKQSKRKLGEPATVRDICRDVELNHSDLDIHDLERIKKLLKLSSIPEISPQLAADTEATGGYQYAGGYQGKRVYAKLSIPAHRLYRTAMTHVIRSGSRRKDGIKFEGDRWAIKITREQASSEEGLDNKWSPCTTGAGVHKKHDQTKEDIIKLDFDRSYNRH